MLAKALFLVVAAQYVVSQDSNSVGNIFDRIVDYADTLDLNTDKDTFFWSEEYWSPPFEHVLHCPSGFEWEGDFTDGSCKPCKPGYFSDKWGHLETMRSRCVPCEPGTYSNGIEQGDCDGHCQYGTTFKTGATMESDCVNPDDMFGKGSFESEVVAKVKLFGDWAFLNDLLKEASGINFYRARGSVEYHEDDFVSTVHVSAVLPNNIAVHAHNFLIDFRDVKDTINDFIHLGDHYSKIIFNLLNNAETFKEFGWKMNRDLLRVKNVEILDVEVHLNQHCEDGYRSVEWEGVGTKCVEDTRTPPSLNKSWYIQYVGETDDCDSLGDEARLRDFVENSWPFPCLENQECEAHFTTCKTLISEECAILIHLIFYDEEAGIGDMEQNINKARMVKYHGDTSFEYSEKNPYQSRQNCGVDPKLDGDGSVSCSAECDTKNGYRLTRSGNCEQCPYGTWFDRESEDVFARCQSCRFFKSVTLFNEVPKSGEDCLSGGYWEEQNEDGVWLYGTNKYIGVELEFSTDATVEMNLCQIIDVKHKFETFCADKMSMDDMSLDDFTDYNLEMLGCLLMDEFSEIYEHSCDGFSKSWSDIMDNFYWEDVACFVAKGIYSIENTDGDCDNLPMDKQRLSMPFEFDQDIIEFDHIGWSSAFWIPLVSNIEKMERFQMNTVSKTVEGVFRQFGMFEMAKLTGLEMMDFVRDLILAVPRGISVVDTNFVYKTTEDEIYCENGNIREKCWTNSACQNRKCSSAIPEIICKTDPCNNCEVFWVTFEGAVVECASTDEPEAKCEVDTEIANGRLVEIGNAFWRVENDRDFCVGCDLFVDSYHYACDTGYRLDNAEIEEDEYNDSRMRCTTKNPYCKSTDNTISNIPKCVPDTCEYEDFENGYIVNKEASSMSACRSAEYRCNQGYKIEGSHIVFCSPDGTKTDMPKCVKDTECQFPEEIENGRFMLEFLDWDGVTKEGWYQCFDGTLSGREVFNGVKCTESDQDYFGCRMETNCPVVIEHGYLMREWEWEEYDTYIGEYRCDEGFELRNPGIFSSSEVDKEAHYGWGACGYSGNGDPENLPRCVQPGSPEPCNMPKDTFNGYRIEEIMNEEYGVIDQAKYRCNNGFMMVETWKGDIGWCRSDGTYELPYCMPPREYFTVEFELVPGFSKMENAGRVKARHIYADGSAGDWYAGCDDHFNGPAAGAICRSLGFRHGKQITGERKMNPIPDLPFGMTNIYCYHDDTLIMSPSCNADDYGQVGWPLCSPEEQVAVQCYDDMWKVDVEFTMVEKKGKMSCLVQVWKEGNMMNLKNMDVHVKWGGVRPVGGDDYEAVYLTEEEFTTTGNFRKKRGFRAKFTGNMDDYDCFFCDVYMGEHIMNPWPDKNHNCPTEYSDDEMYNNMNNMLSMNNMNWVP
ncbi:hypothetical protein ACHWQZ_G004779 [Mnemiopsis leidyi]